jgi:DNA-binding transcriptional LysR family regulator
VTDVFSNGYVCDVDALYSYQGEFAPASRAQFRSANVLPLLQAVREGEAIAVLPSYVAYQDDNLVPVLPAQINFRRSLYVLTHEDNKNLTRVRTVSDFIVSQVQKNRSIFLGEAVFDPSERGLAGKPAAISPVEAS